EARFLTGARQRHRVVDVRNALPKRLPELRTRITLQISVQPAQLGPRAAAHLARHGRWFGGAPSQTIATDLAHAATPAPRRRAAPGGAAPRRSRHSPAARFRLSVRVNAAGSTRRVVVSSARAMNLTMQINSLTRRLNLQRSVELRLT